MGLPDVSINILNGQLGRSEGTADGVAGLILSGPEVTTTVPAEDPEDPDVVVTVIGQSEPKQIFGTSDAKDLGIDAKYDTDNDTDAFRQISDFYKSAGEGAELWIMLLASTITMEDACDVSNDYASKLLNAAGGTIRILGVTRNPDGAYSPTITAGIDPDVIAAVSNAQSLAEAFAAGHMPVRIMIEGRDYQGDSGTLHNFAEGDDNRVAVIGAGLEAAAKSAAVGLALGRAAGDPVQRKISRVRSGDLGLTEAFLSDGSSVASVSDSALGQLHDKGLIVPRTFTGVNGYFFSGDQTATSSADDFSSFARGRVIDKATAIAYQVLVQEIDEEVSLNGNGQLPQVVVKSYKARVETAMNTQMVSQGEASSAELIIDASQNILATDELVATLSITPVGYSSNILVDLKFDNPITTD